MHAPRTTFNPLLFKSLGAGDAPKPTHMTALSQDLTLSTAALEWLAHYEATGYSRRTVALYEQAVRNFDRFLAVEKRSSQIHDIDLPCLEEWRRHQLAGGCSTATVDVYVRALRRLFRWLFVNGRIFADPATQFTGVKVNIPLGLCPTEAEVRQLLDSIRGAGRIALRDRALLETAYATGVRLEELAQLDLDAITLDGIRVLGKGGRERVVPLTTAAVEALDAYLRDGRARFRRAGKNENEKGVFLSIQDGRRMSSQAIGMLIKRRAKACGLKITPHAFRRAFATHLLRGGAALVEVKDLLGHRSFRHLKHYLRFHPGDMLSTARNSNLGRR